MVLLIPVLIFGCILLIIRRYLKSIEYAEPVKTIDNMYIITDQQVENMRKKLQSKRSRF